MAEFIFLGANGSVQEQNSSNTSLLFKDEKGSFMIDASTVYRAVEEDIDMLFITHSHIDHIYALPSFLHQAWLTGRTKPLTIVAPKGIIETIDNLINLFSIREKKNIFEINVIENGTHMVGNMKIVTFKTDHTDSSIGMVIEENNKRVVYTCDTRPLTVINDNFYDSEYLIHETSGLFKDEETLIKKGHSSSHDAAIVAKETRAKKLLLCHLPKGNDKKEAILKEARETFSNSELPKINEEYFF